MDTAPPPHAAGPLKTWKGTRSAGPRPEKSREIPFRRSPNAPRDRYPPASRQVALFRPYRDPGFGVSAQSRRSKRAGHSRPGQTLSPSTTPTAGGPGSEPGPRTVRVSPSDLHRSTAPRRHVRSLANAPFPRDEVEPLCRRFQRGSFKAA